MAKTDRNHPELAAVVARYETLKAEQERARRGHQHGITALAIATAINTGSIIALWAHTLAFTS